MDALRQVLISEVFLLNAALIACIAFQLLNGRINTTGLLFGRTSTGARYFSPERVQLLITTASGAAYYLGLVLSQPKLTEFPAVPTELLGALGGSHALYLGGKAFAMFR